MNMLSDNHQETVCVLYYDLLQNLKYKLSKDLVVSTLQEKTQI